MRTAILTAIILAFVSTAQARPHHHYRQHYDHQNPVAVGLGYGFIHMMQSGGLSGPCRQAAHEGGPCGCHTEEFFFGRSDHVLNGLNMWLADTYGEVFRHVAPGPDTVAWWKHRHVAPVISTVHEARIGNRVVLAVTVDDYFGQHDVSIASVTAFVDPRSR